MATSLIEALAADFEPEKYKDDYRDNLLKMIEAKKQGEEVVATPEPKESKVVDIMEALKASLSKKKPRSPGSKKLGTRARPKTPVKRRKSG